MKTGFLSIVILICVLVSSCSQGSDIDEDENCNDTITNHAAYLNMTRTPDGVIYTEITNPWDKDKILVRYAFVSRDSVVPDNLPVGVSVVRVPVEHAAVFSSVHTGLMEELGVIEALAAVADAGYFPKNDTVQALLNTKRILNLGNSNNPSNELIAASESEVILRSPMAGVSAPKLPSGVVPIECVDYMENTPIGRAEWVLFYGELFGKGAEARKILDNVIEDYSALVYKVGSSLSPKPKILVETETSGVWYVPSGQSYAARLYADAGADYPWSETAGQGSIALSLEEVASKALDADLWLVRSYGYETTPESLMKLNPRYSAFKAVKGRNIYSCDTESRNIFSETSFHPEYVLADYISIFHPDVLPDYKTRYFRK